MIDTDELRTMARDLRTLTHEFTDINLDLVRGWAHTVAPPPQLVVIGARSGWVQAQLAELTGTLVVDSVSLTAEAETVDLHEAMRSGVSWLGSSVRTITGKWNGFLRWGGQEGSRAGSSALQALRTGLSAVSGDARYLAEHPRRAISNILREEHTSRHQTLIMRVLDIPLGTVRTGVVGVADLGTSAFLLGKVGWDSYRYGFTSRQATEDSAAGIRYSSDSVFQLSDTLVGIVAKPVTVVITGTSLGLALSDDTMRTNLYDYLSPSHYEKWVFKRFVVPSGSSDGGL